MDGGSGDGVVVRREEERRIIRTTSISPSFDEHLTVVYSMYVMLANTSFLLAWKYRVNTKRHFTVVLLY